MYIYNGKFYKDIPQIRDYNKKVKVDKENEQEICGIGKEVVGKRQRYGGELRGGNGRFAVRV